MIPERYKNKGFTKVGQVKKAPAGSSKKWQVLAKKGDKYKIVSGGYRGMEDFSQHKNKDRQKRFWDRMGGKNSAKAKDPFSPLYWHKRLGKWQTGGENELMQLLQMVAEQEQLSIEEVVKYFQSLSSEDKQSFVESVKSNIEESVYQTGDIVVDEEGWRRNPQNKPVIIPHTNSISMKDVTTTGKAFDLNTGQFLTDLEPEYEYLFNKEMDILEVPQGQRGKKLPTSIGSPEFEDWLYLKDMGIPLGDIQVKSKTNFLPEEDLDLNVPPDTKPQSELTQEQRAKIAELKNDVKEGFNMVVDSDVPAKVKQWKLNLNNDRLTNLYANQKYTQGMINEPQFRGIANLRGYTTPEIDIRPIYQEIDNQLSQSLSNVNMNSSAGQAIAAQLSANAMRQKVNANNEIAQKNAQIRGQNAAVQADTFNKQQQLQTQYDAQYYDNVLRARAARESIKNDALADLALNEAQKNQFLNDLKVIEMSTPSISVGDDGTITQDTNVEFYNRYEPRLRALEEEAKRLKEENKKLKQQTGGFNIKFKKIK